MSDAKTPQSNWWYLDDESDRKLNGAAADLLKTVSPENSDPRCIENKEAERRFYQLLERAQCSGAPQWLNQALNENHYAAMSDKKLAQKGYTDASPEYTHIVNPPETTAFWNPEEPYLGWKLHLNVRAEDVPFVKEFLLQNDFSHKYLSGGEIEDGKIFTIYCGSKKMADRNAQRIVAHCKDVLCAPLAFDEIVIAPGVCGRFVGDLKDFTQYGHGVKGMGILHDRASGLVFSDASNRKSLLLQAFTMTYSALARSYGEYFYGSCEQSE